MLVFGIEKGGELRVRDRARVRDRTRDKIVLYFNL